MTPWRTISIALQASTAGYVRGLTGAAAATESFGRKAEAGLGRSDRAVKNSTRTWEGFKGKAVPALLAVSLALGASIGEAIRWESAFAGVAKTVDGTTAQMKDLEDGLLNMALRLPATREEIAGVAEAAGALGIARPAIEGFTEVMIGLGEATDLSADDAATQLAQFANIMGTAQDQFGSLGDTLVHLGNNGASTEREILALSLRLAGAGKVVGLTEDEVMALANAMASVGIPAELGGGAFSRILMKIHDAALSGGEGLEAFAEVSGQSAADFAAAWKNDPASAVQDFVTGLADVQAAGGNIIQTLGDLGIKGTQERDTILRLVGAVDTLDQSMSDAANSQGALGTEVEKRYATAESQIAIFKNKVTDVARSVGTALIPMLLDAMDAIERFGRWLGEAGGEAADRLSGAWGSLVTAGKHLADVLSMAWDVAEPFIVGLGALGGSAIIGGIKALASTIEGVSGFLADNEALVRGITTALVTLAAIKTFSVLISAADKFEDHLSNLSEFAGQSKLLSGLKDMGGGFRDMAGAGAGAFKNLDNYNGRFTRGLGGVKSGLKTTLSAIGGVNAAIIGIGAAAAIGFALFGDRADAARRKIDRMTKGIDRTSTADLAGMAREMQKLSDNSYSASGQILGIFGGSASDEYAKKAREFADEASALGDKLEEVGEKAGVSQLQARYLVDQLNLDPTALSVEELATAVQKADQSMVDGDKSAQDLADATAIIGDEAATAAEKVDALKSAIDNLIGTPLNEWDAETRFAAAIASVGDTKGDPEKDVAPTPFSLDRGTEEGRVWADIMSDIVGSAQKLSQTRIDLEAPVEEAIQPLRDAQTAIEMIGTQAGLSKGQINDLLDELRISDGHLATLMASATGDVDAADTAIKAVTLQFEDFRGTRSKAFLEVDDKSARKTLDTAEQMFDLYAEKSPEAKAMLSIDDPVERMTAVNKLLEDYVNGDHTGAILLDTMEPEAKQKFVEEELKRFVGTEWQAIIDAKTSGTAEVEKELDHVARARTAEIIVWTEEKTRAVAATRARDWELYGHYYGGSNRRWGGIDHYAAGGVRPAMVGSGKNMVWWDEPETGGEAYIPRLGNLTRSRQVLGVAADWLDCVTVPKATWKALSSVTPMAAGGIMAPRPTAPVVAPIGGMTARVDSASLAAALAKAGLTGVTFNGGISANVTGATAAAVKRDVLRETIYS